MTKMMMLQQKGPCRFRVHMCKQKEISRVYDARVHVCVCMCMCRSRGMWLKHTGAWAPGGNEAVRERHNPLLFFSCSVISIFNFILFYTHIYIEFIRSCYQLLVRFGLESMATTDVHAKAFTIVSWAIFLFHLKEILSIILISSRDRETWLQ